jgi:hypothetical protein
MLQPSTVTAIMQAFFKRGLQWRPNLSTSVAAQWT